MIKAVKKLRLCSLQEGLNMEHHILKLENSNPSTITSEHRKHQQQQQQ